MMKDEGFGFMYKTSIEGKQLHFVGYNFVDDTDIIQSGQPGESFQVLATRIQAAIDYYKYLPYKPSQCNTTCYIL
jgi:hypothetical protein